MVNQNKFTDPNTDSMEQCNFFPQVALFVDGELKDASEHCFLQHLESCEECQHNLAKEQELAHSFVMEMLQVEPQESLSARFEQSLQQGELLQSEASAHQAVITQSTKTVASEGASAFWSSPWLSSAAAVLLMLGLAFFVTKANPLNENSGQIAKKSDTELANENGNDENKGVLGKQPGNNPITDSSSGIEQVNVKPEENKVTAAHQPGEKTEAMSETTNQASSGSEPSVSSAIVTNSDSHNSENEEVLSAIEVVPGDVNLDGLLDAGDMNLVMNSLRDGDLQSMNCPAAADIDGDHALTPNDVLMMTTRINQSVQSLEGFIQVQAEDHLGCDASVCP